MIEITDKQTRFIAWAFVLAGIFLNITLPYAADSGHAEGHLGLKARGSSDHAEAHRNEVTLSFS